MLGTSPAADSDGTVAPASRRASRVPSRIDLLVLVGFTSIWIFLVGPIVATEHLHGYDVFREAGYAAALDNGTVFTDSSYVGESIWYPPLSPIIMRWIASLADTSVLACYSWSQLLLNLFIPLGLYWLALRAWGRTIAIVATVTFMFGVPWWAVELAHGQPAVHAVIGGWGAVALYCRAMLPRSARYVLIGGVLVGVSFWHHPLIPMFLTILFLVYPGWLHLRRRVASTRQILKKMVLMNAIALSIGLPLIWILLHGPILHDGPRTYFAPELNSVKFALMGGNPLIWIPGFAGCWLSMKRATRSDQLMLFALALLICFQIPGYLVHNFPDLKWWIPAAVPHEFQRLFQLVWVFPVAIGIVGLGRLLNRFSVIAQTATISLFCLAIGVPGLLSAPTNLRTFLLYDYTDNPSREASLWIQTHTDPQSVFACDAELAFRWVVPTTGRKAWVVAPGHSNPRVDWHQRVFILNEMRQAHTADQLWLIARAHGIQYIIANEDWSPGVLSHEASNNQSDFFEVAYQGSMGMTVFKTALPIEGKAGKKRGQDD